MSDADEYLSEESYEFEFEEDDDGEAIQTQSIEDDSPETQYYSAKGLKEDSIDEAIQKFERLIATADAKADTEWVFKSYKQLAKVHYQQQNYTLVLNHTARLMELLPNLNGNYAEESISKILTRCATCTDHTFVKNLYDVIVIHLQNFILPGSSSNRLWLKININRLNNLLDLNDLGPCRELISLINSRLEKVSELIRNSFALEMIAAEIEFTMKTCGNSVRLNELYHKSQDITPAITHPQVMGVIRECGATVQFFKGSYDKARIEFYESFKFYDEAGSSSKNKVLKYLIICCLLAESEVNPFESQETHSYTQLSEYKNLIDLVEAYEALDLGSFMETTTRIKDTGDPLHNDLIFARSRELILRNIKVKLFINYAKAYSTLRLDFIIDKLCLSGDDQLGQLLIELANSGTISKFRINFAERYVTFGIEDENSLIPPTLDEDAVKNNVRVLHRLSFEGPWQSASAQLASDSIVEDDCDGIRQINALLEEERNPRCTAFGSTVFDMLFGSSAFQSDASVEQEEWLKFMKSAIPKTKVEASSQKDQVILEQREESEQKLENSVEDDEATANTQQGILGSSINNGERSVNLADVCDSKDKLGLLHEWAHQLCKVVYDQ